MSTKRKTKKYIDLYEVVWDDHWMSKETWSTLGTGDFSNHNINSGFMVSTIGFIVAETKDHLILASTYIRNTRTFATSATILKVAIRSKKKIGRIEDHRG